MPNINIPGVGVVAFPDTMSQDEIGVAIRQDIMPGVQKSGFGAGIKAGIEGLKGAYYGGKYGITESPEDRAALLQSQARQEELYQGPGWEDVKEAFKERGILPGLGRTWEAAKGTLGQSLPYMAAPVAAAALAPEAAIAGVGLGTLGFLGASGAQYTGQNVGRQVAEQEAAKLRGETPQELSLGRAAAASVPAALLDRFALGQTFKGTGLGKLFGQEGKEGIEAVARQVVENGANPSKLKSILAGGGRGIAAEIPNEVGQQILERAQAGLDLTNEDALREYKEAAFGATLLGGPFGGAGGMGMRGAGIKTAKGWEARAEEETQKFNQKEADRLKAMETTKTSVLDGIRAANEREAQRIGWQGDIQQVGAEALDRSLTLMDSPEGVDTILGDMKTHFPGTPAAEIKKLQVQLRTYKQRMLAQQKEDAKKAEASAFAEATPDLLGEIRPEAPSIQEAISRPEFALEAPQPSPQMELNLGQPEPLATPKAPAPITDQYLRGFGLDKRNDAYKALLGLDLNKPADVAQAKTVINDVLEGKASNVQGKVDKMIRTDPRFQEQATFFDEIDKQQADLDAAQAEAARQKRNEGLAQLLAQLETENAAKEEAAAASASVPSEAGVESTAGGLEPSVAVYDQSGGQGTEAGVEPSGEPLGLAERDVEGAVETTGDTGSALTQDELMALFAEQGITPENKVVPFEERAQAAAETRAAEEKTIADEQAKWDALLEAQGLGAELEPIPTEEYETDEAEQARRIEERRAAKQERGELTGELNWEAGDADFDARQTTAPAPATGMEKGAVQGIVDRLTQGWKRKVNVAVKNIEDETPGRQNALRAYGLDTAKGYIDHDGTVVILANNNANEADVAATLFHETLGHLGLRLKFKEELTNMMEKFYHTNAQIKRMANKWLLDHKGEYDENLAPKDKYAKAVEEVLAERAEAGRLPAGVLDKIKAFINKWARKAGLNVDYSDAEVRAILDQAQKEITEKKGEAVTTPAKEIAPRSAAASRLEQMGREVKQVEDSKPFQERVDQLKEVAKAPAKWRDLVETMVFSADAKINNEIRRGLMDTIEQGGQEAADAMAKLYSISTSQALHNEAVAHQFIEQGNVKYNPELYKYEAVDDKNSWANMVQELKKIADQYGFTFPEVEAYAQAAIEARRLKGINEFNAKIEAEADALEARGKKKVAEKQREKLKYSHMTDEQIETGLGFFKDIPELNKIVDIWNGIRKNAMEVGVDAGIFSKERADELLEIMDYVPFYRVEQLEAKAGPKEFSRGLLDAARDYRFKGSEQEVNNIFDNMERWASYTIRRSVNNKTAQNLVQVAQEVLQEAKEVPKAQRGMEANTVAIWQNGERKFYEFSDPLFVKAFTGLEPVALPAFKALSTFSNALRKNIVLNPLFSVSQLSQDSFAAMLTSGLKHPFRLPLEVMKEFVKTLRGTSEAHQALKAVGAAGVRDYSATISRLDAEMAAGLKAPSTWQKLLSPLEKFSMASDNAVRQAIYNMTMQETGGDKAKAIERAFEIINFRRKGASGTLAIAGQVIPFFNAYLQAQNVAYKVLTGRGVSPTARSEAKKVFIGNATKIAALAFIYAAVMSDDDDYKKMDPTIRDRHWIIPGTGLMLPVRTDLFSMPKIIAEHTYALMTDQGFEDGTKARRAMTDALVNAITGPTPVPQAFKPMVEVVLNRNFYTGRPIIGRGIENLKTSEQYTASTSELAKAIGSTGIIAPVNVDHLIRGYLGTTGGLTLMAMDSAINSASGVPKPSRSTQDILASTPGLSTFVSKEFGGADKTDFYELKGMVDEASATLSRYAKTGQMEAGKEYLGEERTQNLLKIKSQVNQIQAALSKLRERENLIREMPDSRMSADQKEVAVRQIREQEQRMLSNVSKLRKLAGL